MKFNSANPLSGERGLIRSGEGTKSRVVESAHAHTHIGRTHVNTQPLPASSFKWRAGVVPTEESVSRRRAAALPASTRSNCRSGGKTCRRPGGVMPRCPSPGCRVPWRAGVTVPVADSCCYSSSFGFTRVPLPLFVSLTSSCCSCLHYACWFDKKHFCQIIIQTVTPSML